MANSGTKNGVIITTDAATSRINLGTGTMALLSSPVGVVDGGTGRSSYSGLSVFAGNGTSAIQLVTASSDGQLLIGSTGSLPVWALPTSSDGSVTITPGAGTLTISPTQSSTSQLGATTRATAAQSTAGSNTTAYITPSTLTSRLAAPGTIGGTTPGTGIFTTINLTSVSGPSLTSGSGAASASAAKGSMYMRTDGTTTNDRAYTNTNGTTTWTAFVTVA